MYISYHPIYNHPVPDNHRFPMQKYALLPQQLLHEGIAEPADFHSPLKVSLETLCLAHTPDYVHKFVHLQLSHKEALPIGFVQNQQLVDRELTLVQGTIEAALWALRTAEVGFNIAGGTHHEIFRHDPRVFTFSMHAEGNYPFVKEQSNRDIALPTGTTDAAYLSVLTSVLPEIITTHQPDFVFYQSGVDVLSSDKLGKLSLSVQGCADRDRFVFNLCRQHHLPVQCSMGGGYSPQLSAILRAHTNTFMMSQ